MSVTPRPERGPAIVFCGPMGAGKTSVGRIISQLWDAPMRDTDDDIEASTGSTIGDIFLHDGEPRFREMEHEAVTLALHEHDGVLALGGGAVIHEGSRRELADYTAVGGVVVFLDVSVEYAAERVGLDHSRPLLVGDSVKRWMDLMRARREMYEGVATIRVLTDGTTPKGVAREVERRLQVAARETWRTDPHRAARTVHDG